MGRLQAVVLRDYSSIVMYHHNYGGHIQAWFERHSYGHIFKVNNRIIATPRDTWLLKDYAKDCLGRWCPRLARTLLRGHFPDLPKDTKPVPYSLARRIYKEAMQELYKEGLDCIYSPGHFNELLFSIKIIAEKLAPKIYIGLDDH